MSFENIIFPVDFSERCQSIVPHVIAACKRFRSKLVLAHVAHIPEVPCGAVDSPVVFAYPIDQVMEDATRTLRHFGATWFPGIPVDCIVKEGDPALWIAEIARADNSLIMMPTRGRGPFRAALLGSVTTKVLHDAPCPVWTDAHSQNHGFSHTDWRRIVCAIDTDDEASRLICFASNLAKDQNAKVFLTHAVLPPQASAALYVDDGLTEFLKEAASKKIAELQGYLGTKFSVCIESGNVSEVLANAARHHDADLMLIGRGVLPAFAGRLRSKVSAIIRDTPCPVLSI